MAQTILMIFDKFDVHYWLDYGKNSFLFKQEGSKGEREGGGGHWEKKEVDGGLVSCSKNNNGIAANDRLMINRIFQNRVVVDFPRSLTFIIFSYFHLLFIPNISPFFFIGSNPPDLFFC